MNLAIIHYHLNRGGVTQVIANHLRSLELTADEKGGLEHVALLYDGQRAGFSDEMLAQFERLQVSLCDVPGLKYDAENDAANPRALANELSANLHRLGFAPDSTLLHVHNHSLGKNVSLPGALSRLSGDGFRLLLQIHDFAEDFRPDVYRRLSETIGAKSTLADALYPQAHHIHYATLNHRDFDVLHQAGIRDGNLHLLPNPIAEFGELPARVDARRLLAERFGLAPECAYWLYPVRGIRRKNLGEAVLWSLLTGGRIAVGFTLPPQNPIEAEAYSQWKRLAARLSLPCVFETGAAGGMEFKENLAAADLILTTSVAEGFGMVFAECWLAGRRLVGRNLPEITADFVRSGVDLGQLYPRLSVPLGWIGEDDFRSSLSDAYIKAREAYHEEPVTQRQLDREIDKLIVGGTVDFAALSSRLQQRVIEGIHQDPRRREFLLETNPAVADEFAMDDIDAGALVGRNAHAIRDGYSLEVSGRRLRELYGSVMASECDEDIRPLPHGERILDSFLDISRLHPIRLE